MANSYKYRDVGSQTTVWINSKVGAYNLKKLEYRDPSTEIGEGRPIAKDSTSKKGRLADNTDNVVYINFYSTERMTSRDYQKDPITDDTEIALSAGGLSGVEGSSIEVGIPVSLWDTGRTPTIGDYVCVHASSGKFESVIPGSITGRITFGRITDIDGANRAIFEYSTLGEQK